jgi:hypothetical protein
MNTIALQKLIRERFGADLEEQKKISETVTKDQKRSRKQNKSRKK